MNENYPKKNLDIKASLEDDDEDNYNKFGGGNSPKKDTKSKTPVLDTYSRDLTKIAEEGKLDPIVLLQR